MLLQIDACVRVPFRARESEASIAAGLLIKSSSLF